jgi:DNA-binding transcriptional ArsR family regulator
MDANWWVIFSDLLVNRESDAGLDDRAILYDTRNMEKTDAIAALAALAQESRLDVFRLLVQAGAEGMPAGRIGERLGLPSPTLSFHLNQLRQAGLVRSGAKGGR